MRFFVRIMTSMAVAGRNADYSEGGRKFPPACLRVGPACLEALGPPGLQIARAHMLYNLRQSARGKRDYRRAARERLHRHQRTGLGHSARYDQALRLR